VEAFLTAVKDPQRQGITLGCRCVNQRGEVVIDGTATWSPRPRRFAARR
jgi:hypothetical protein